jgi:DNA polymerase
MAANATKTPKRSHLAADPKLATAKAPAAKTIGQLRKIAAGCHACDLWKTATQTVFGEGPSPAKIMFVGEQPGDQGDRAGHPFVSPAGKLLDRASGSKLKSGSSDHKCWCASERQLHKRFSVRLFA